MLCVCRRAATTVAASPLLVVPVLCVVPRSPTTEGSRKEGLLRLKEVVPLREVSGTGLAWVAFVEPGNVQPGPGALAAHPFLFVATAHSLVDAAVASETQREG